MSNFKFYPFGTKVVVKRIDEEKLEGISIPDNAKRKSYKGKVVTIGSGSVGKLDSGDVVLFKEHCGVDFNFEGEEMTIIEFSDIYGKLKK